MHDMRPQPEGNAPARHLGLAFDLSAAEADALIQAVMPELASLIEQNTLSRRGLADLVAAIGSGHHAGYVDGTRPLGDDRAQAEGCAILGHMLGSKARSRALAARAARRSGLSEERIRAMLPPLANMTMGTLAVRARLSLAEVLSGLPSLGRWSLGSPHADLADILRRGCGAGPYAPMQLKRVVRRALAQAGGFQPRGPLSWYAQFAARPLVAPVRAAAARLLNGSQPSPTDAPHGRAEA